MNRDRIGRCGGLLAGMIVCGLVLAVVGCEPQSHTIRVRATDLSVAMVGDENDFILQDAQAASDDYMTDEEDGLDAESRAMAREYLAAEKGNDSEAISRVEAMKMAMLPIHGGAPKAVVHSAPAPARKSAGGGKKSKKSKKGNKNNSRRFPRPKR